MRISKLLSQCEQTTVQNELLRDLLIGDAKNHVPGAVNFLASGHGRGSPTRQILSYIIRRALGIVRLPGTYDVRMRQSHFEHLDPEQLEAAVVEAKRIHEHTQAELKRVWGQSTLPLVRGTRYEESAAIRYLLDKLDGETIPFYLSTLTFFNHLGGAFNGDFCVRMHCPVEWIWASEYTLKMLDNGGTCEEFIVACTTPDGLIELPRSAFETRITPHPHEPLKVNGFAEPKSRRDIVGHALAELVHEGFEPDDWLHYTLKYSPGNWEYRFRKWAERLVNLGRRWDAFSKRGRATVRRDLTL